MFKKKLDEKIKANADRGTKQVKPNVEGDEPQFHEADHSLVHIFRGSTTYESKRQYKAVEREVNLVLTGPTLYLKWSEQPITFDQTNHPAKVPYPGQYPVMVQPTILNIKVSRTLVDGGSSLNLIFFKTLDYMGIQRSELKARVVPFHSITSNSLTMPLGQIELPVMFGMPNNFCIEKLTFDVMDFDTAYIVILGCPMLGKFMVVVHDAY